MAASTAKMTCCGGMHSIDVSNVFRQVSAWLYQNAVAA